jgi:hypothetical protein
MAGKVFAVKDIIAEKAAAEQAMDTTAKSAKKGKCGQQEEGGSSGSQEGGFYLASSIRPVPSSDRKYWEEVVALEQSAAAQSQGLQVAMEKIAETASPMQKDDVAEDASEKSALDSLRLLQDVPSFTSLEGEVAETASQGSFTSLEPPIQEKASQGAACLEPPIQEEATTEVGRLDTIKARGLDAIKFAKDTSFKTSEAIAIRVASAKANVVSRVSNIKARAVEGVTGMKKTTLDLTTGVSTRMADTRGYVVGKLSIAIGMVSSIIAGTQAGVLARVSYTQTKTMDLIADSKAKAKLTFATASTKASELNIKVKDVAADPKTKTVVAGAATGAAVLGTTGGAVGMASGSIIGAAVGLVPALFTFGLSIPIGAAIGGGTGLCVGTAVGGTTGLVAGGAAGYKKDSISSGTKKVFAQAGEGFQYTKETAGASRQYVLKQVNSSASFLRARVQRISGTGGTETLPSESD